MNYKDSEFLVPIFDFDILHMELNTPLFILALVLIVMFFMNLWLFNPVLSTLENRRNFLKKLGETTDKQRDEIGELAENYDKRLAEVKVELSQSRAEAHKESQEAVKEILQQARHKSGEELEQALSTLRGEVEQARKTLGGSARTLAGKAAEMILNR